MEENTEKSSEYNDYSKSNQQYLAEEDRPLKSSKQVNNFDEMPIEGGNKFPGDINAVFDEKPVGVGVAGNNTQFLSEYPEGIFLT